jgi:hypothetical protein
MVANLKSGGGLVGTVLVCNYRRSIDFHKYEGVKIWNKAKGLLAYRLPCGHAQSLVFQSTTDSMFNMPSFARGYLYINACCCYPS